MLLPILRGYGNSIQNIPNIFFSVNRSTTKIKINFLENVIMTYHLLR